MMHFLFLYSAKIDDERWVCMSAVTSILCTGIPKCIKNPFKKENGQIYLVEATFVHLVGVFRYRSRRATILSIIPT